ncbi:MAG: hypothetical protein FWC11_02905 [Firmicutes bacterium]|nr:hypothetical protein [Bacillota bacterium]
MKNISRHNQTNETQNSKKRVGMRGIIPLKFLVIIWIVVLVAMIVTFLVVELGSGDRIDAYTGRSLQLIALITSFAAFVVQSVFTFAILNYNSIMRQTMEENRQIADDVNERSEEFRELQFASSNYTVIDFVDYMTLYAESSRYTKKLKKDLDFTHYMKNENIELDEIKENFDEFAFTSVRIPIKIIDGKTISKVKFSRVKFTEDEKENIFLPCGGICDSLILFNEKDHRSEIVINLITRKDDRFFNQDVTSPFLKVKMKTVMQSLLGVAVTGEHELYFSNEKKNKDHHKYEINSTHFEVSEMPKLVIKGMGKL